MIENLIDRHSLRSYLKKRYITTSRLYSVGMAIRQSIIDQKKGSPWGDTFLNLRKIN